jgi:hypothetical protein
MFDLDAPVIVLDDSDEFQPEHLVVMVRAVFWNNACCRQDFLGDGYVSIAGLRLHPARHRSIWI